MSSTRYLDVVVGVLIPESDLWAPGKAVRECARGHRSKRRDDYCGYCGHPMEDTTETVPTALYKSLLRHFGDVDHLYGDGEEEGSALWGVGPYDYDSSYPDEADRHERLVLGIRVKATARDDENIVLGTDVSALVASAAELCAALGVSGEVRLHISAWLS